MKLIFLDIDGVFNSDTYYVQRKDFTPWHESKEFDPKCVEQFNEIIGQTGAKIVVSSCWRRGNLNYLQTLFQMVGICGEVIGETDKFWGENFHPVPRGCEIEDYLYENHNYPLRPWAEDGERTDVESYVIIDDDCDMLYTQKDNFVHVDSDVGLTKKDVKETIRILNETTHSTKNTRTD